MKLDQQIRATKVVQENEVGITQYINEANRTGGGFFGTIKQKRYSDFLVNEIDLNGQVVRLLDEGVNLGKTRKEKKLEKRQLERADLQNKTSEEIEQIKEAKKAEEEAKNTEEDSQSKYDLTDENRAALLELITDDELKQIEKLFTTGSNMETKTIFPSKSKPVESYTSYFVNHFKVNWKVSLQPKIRLESHWLRTQRIQEERTPKKVLIMLMKMEL